MLWLVIERHRSSYDTSPTKRKIIIGMLGGRLQQISPRNAEPTWWTTVSHCVLFLSFVAYVVRAADDSDGSDGDVDEGDDGDYGDGGDGGVVISDRSGR